MPPVRPDPTDLQILLADHSLWLAGGGASGRRADLRAMDLSGVDFPTLLAGHPVASLAKANFAQASLCGANLRGVDLSGCSFEAASLHGADLAGAVLESVVLTDTDLSGARLDGADLSKVIGLTARQLSGATVVGATLPELVDLQGELKNLGDAHSSAQAVLWGVLLASVYAWLGIATTTDRLLVLGGGLYKLPIVHVDIPIQAFFWITPLLLAGAQLYLLTALRALRHNATSLPALLQNGRQLETHVAGESLLSVFLTPDAPARDVERSIRSLTQGIALTVVLGAIPFTIVGLWLRYLPRHDPVGTLFHTVLAVVVYAATVGIAASMFRASPRGRCAHSTAAHVLPRQVRRVPIVATTLLVTLLSRETAPVFVLVAVVGGIRAGWRQVVEHGYARLMRRLVARGRTRSVRYLGLARVVLVPGAALAVATAWLVRRGTMPELATMLGDPTSPWERASAAFLLLVAVASLSVVAIALGRYLAGACRRAVLRGERRFGPSFVPGVAIVCFAAGAIGTSYSALTGYRPATGVLSRGGGGVSVLKVEARWYDPRWLVPQLLDQFASGAFARLRGEELSVKPEKWVDDDPFDPFAWQPHAPPASQAANVAAIRGARLADADLRYAWLNDAFLVGADLRGADLSNADLSGADLRGALMGENTTVAVKVRLMLGGCPDPRGACVEFGINKTASETVGHTDASHAYLIGADLRGAYLTHADLSGANLTFANLEGADISQTTLDGATLENAWLHGARVEGATVRGADLSMARGLTSLQASLLVSDASTRFPPGIRPPALEGCQGPYSSFATITRNLELPETVRRVRVLATGGVGVVTNSVGRAVVRARISLAEAALEGRTPGRELEDFVTIDQEGDALVVRDRHALGADTTEAQCDWRIDIDVGLPSRFGGFKSEPVVWGEQMSVEDVEAAGGLVGPNAGLLELVVAGSVILGIAAWRRRVRGM